MDLMTFLQAPAMNGLRIIKKPHLKVSPEILTGNVVVFRLGWNGRSFYTAYH